MTKTAIKTKGLGKRYGSFWALENCSITVPAGSISALVGPNGAGKTTLLKLLVGLSRPSSGEGLVLGYSGQQPQDFLADIGYLAQEIPLYKSLSAREHSRMGKHLNKRWDEAFVHERLQQLDIPLDRPVGQLSGGQRAQVGLALALAKKPKLLLLDEPVASLDPLARHEFLSSLAQAAADQELTVIMSSHVLSDLERVCDHIIVLTSGKTQLCDSTENVIATHKILTGPKQDNLKQDDFTIVHQTHTARQSTLLVRAERKVALPPKWQRHEPNIEEIILAYMGQAKDMNEGSTR